MELNEVQRAMEQYINKIKLTKGDIVFIEVKNIAARNKQVIQLLKTIFTTLQEQIPEKKFVLYDDLSVSKIFDVSEEDYNTIRGILDKYMQYDHDELGIGLQIIDGDDKEEPFNERK